MADDKIARALRALGRDVQIPPVELAGSMSRSGVYRVHVDGHHAVLKVTGADEEQDNARRELTFYQTLANQVPVRTPRLLDYVDNDDLTALLLSAHTQAPPAPEWDRSAWLDVARQLAALHSFPAPERAPWVHTPWLRRVLDRPPIRIAADYWSHTDAADFIGSVLDAPATLAPALSAIPDCFIHGDCHVDNLLRDGDRVVWADWQVTGIGSPAIDLAFLWGRAHSDSANPPRDAMLREYATHRGIDRAPVHRSLIAAELGFLLFGWPEYARYHTQDERRRTAHRLVQLIGDWHKLPA